MRRSRKETNPNTTDTLIGPGTCVKGNITSKAGLRIEGQLTGDVNCEGDISIGENGRLQSSITARNVYNAGVVEGSIHTRGLLTITQTGKVIGEISAKSLIIAEGGVFQGTSRMEDRAGTPEPEKLPGTGDQKDRINHLKKVEKEAVNE